MQNLLSGKFLRKAGKGQINVKPGWGKAAQGLGKDWRFGDFAGKAPGNLAERPDNCAKRPGKD